MKLKQKFIKKSLPHNFLAEQMILNCLILNPETMKFTIKLLDKQILKWIKNKYYFKNRYHIIF